MGSQGAIAPPPFRSKKIVFSRKKGIFGENMVCPPSYEEFFNKNLEAAPSHDQFLDSPLSSGNPSHPEAATWNSPEYCSYQKNSPFLIEIGSAGVSVARFFGTERTKSEVKKCQKALTRKLCKKCFLAIFKPMTFFFLLTF